MEYLFDFFGLAVSIIYGYIFVPFAVCNLLYVIFKPFDKSQKLKASIQFAERIVCTAGIVYLIIYILNTLNILINFKEYDIFGKYALSYWPQITMWFICSQIIRVNFIKENSFFRILISILILISIEYYIILGTTIARDYPHVEYLKLLKPTFIYAILFTKSFMFGFFCYAFVMRNKGQDNEHILDKEIK